MRLNLTQHGEPHLDSTWKGHDRLKHSLDDSESGAWSFLVGEVICLVDSDNERGLHLPVAGALARCRAMRNTPDTLAGGNTCGCLSGVARPESGALVASQWVQTLRL